MRSKTWWIWSWTRTHGLKPAPYVSFLMGTLVGSLPTEAHPLRTAYWTGPLHLRVAVWFATLCLLGSLARSLYVRFSHRRIQRSEFFSDNAAPQLGDWEVDPHWLAFDGIFEMAVAPNLAEPLRANGDAGWVPSDVVLQVRGDFVAAPRLEKYYAEWRSLVDSRKLSKDGVKYVLRNHPSSETDEHFVRLELERTRWSRVQSFLFGVKKYGRNVLFDTADPSFVAGRKPRLDLTRSECPHSLGMHAIVITSDDKMLALQRPGPDRTDYYPYTWSFSFEEQLSDSDFSDGVEEIDVSGWLTRGVRQEILGPEVDRFFDVRKARILSLIFEEELANPSLVALAPVSCSSVELGSILPHAPDRAEWIRYEFYALDPPYDGLALAFRNAHHVDGSALHPTSRYRIYSGLSAICPPNLLDVTAVLGHASD